jgi:hypothetical protein
MDAIEPCFAFMKMMKQEHLRVQSSGGTISSRWFTEYEAELLSESDNGQIDMREPLPDPELIPVTALQIISSTLYTQLLLRTLRRPYISQFIYAVRCTCTYFTTLASDKPDFCGKSVITQQTIDKSFRHGERATQFPATSTKFFVTDPDLARKFGVSPEEPIDQYDKYDYLSHRINHVP